MPKLAAARMRRSAMAVVMAASLMDLVDLTMVNVALPNIRTDIGVPSGTLPWITGGYALAFAVVLAPGTWLGGIHGRRRVFLVGMGAFTVASAMGGLAPGPETLVAARVAQGAAAALMVPQVPFIIDAVFPAGGQGKAVALFGAVIGLGSVAGPVFGAALLESDLFGLGWRSVLLVNLPIGLAGLVLGRLCIAERRDRLTSASNWPGTAVAATGLLMILYPLSRGPGTGWSPWGLLSIAGGSGMLAAFVCHERARGGRRGGPLVVTSLFTIRSYAVGVGIEFLYGTLGGIYFLAWCFHMQAGLGWSPLRAALCMLFFGAAVAVFAGLSRDTLFPRYGRKVLQAGALTQLTGALVYGWQTQHYGTDIQPWQILPVLVLLGGGMGLTVAPLSTVLLADVSHERLRSAAALGNTTYQLGTALGMILLPVAFPGLLDTGHPVSVAFSHTLRWLACLLATAFLLTFALPRHPRRHPSEVSRAPGVAAGGTSSAV
ncbi:MFS transporter [Streptomyces sp. NBC_00654]|uniref:MFS transporter n=1 Tax=Streptomyces sp. NBC_00654 TaxID=2975799 RepID=UPI002257A617|nr:MFS transporter [Streptomyces sp. NBC_00654]MCX4970533.1 MFS transporter [Streptomyces sp. NBC_00654]